MGGYVPRGLSAGSGFGLLVVVKKIIGVSLLLFKFKTTHRLANLPRQCGGSGGKTRGPHSSRWRATTSLQLDPSRFAQGSVEDSATSRAPRSAPLTRVLDVRIAPRGRPLSIA